MGKWVWGRWPLLVVAGFLIAFGGFAISDESSGGQVAGAIVIGIGVLTLGSWITTEVIDWWTSAAEREDERNKD